MERFRPTKNHCANDLTILFEFTKVVGNCWEWLSYSDNRSIIIANAQTLLIQESAPLTDAFAEESKLYSASFFKTYERIMEHNPLQKCFAPHIENFFAFIKAGKELQVTYELLLVYKNICVDNPDNDINAITT